MQTRKENLRGIFDKWNTNPSLANLVSSSFKDGSMIISADAFFCDLSSFDITEISKLSKQVKCTYIIRVGMYDGYYYTKVSIFDATEDFE